MGGGPRGSCRPESLSSSQTDEPCLCVVAAGRRSFMQSMKKETKTNSRLGAGPWLPMCQGHGVG